MAEIDWKNLTDLALVVELEKATAEFVECGLALVDAQFRLACAATGLVDARAEHSRRARAEFEDRQRRRAERAGG